MPALVTCFNTASENIEPIASDYLNAVAAHGSVRACLELDQSLKAMDVDTTLIGSYKRKTAIRRVKDVDVFAKLPSVDTGLSADDVTEIARTALIKTFGADSIEPQERSTLVSFASFDLTVDVVLARPVDEHWQIPDGANGWLETNPEAMTALTTSMNTRYEELYVPVVKLIRQTRRQVLGNAKPGGYLLEVLAYHAFNSGISGEDRGTLYANALGHISVALTNRSNGGNIADPTMPLRSIHVRATDNEWASATTIFTDAASLAASAIQSSDECAAAKTFRDLLGKNSAGNWVFPLPALCNDDGTKKSFNVTAPGSAQVAAGGGRFA